ncbi:MAG: hypothetical protein EXR49_02600 [Dehalococcoidia bacterium]|nr:hypothetical protein [Dehalococcoidia bacterium]
MIRIPKVGLTLTALAAAATLVVAACGGGSEAPEATTAPAAVAAPTATRAPSATSAPAATAAPAAATAAPRPTAAPTATPGPRRGGTLLYVPPADLRGLDPIGQSYFIADYHAQMIYDFPIALDDNNVPQVQMLDSWQTSADGMTYTFKLRAGLRFHDGRAVEAEDVMLSARRFTAKNTYGVLLGRAAEGWSTVDATTFQLKLKAPFGLVLYGMAAPGSVPLPAMPREEAKLGPNDTAPAKIGSGPFKFVDWKVGDRVIYERFDGYSPRNEAASGYTGGKRVFLDRVEWRIITDGNTKIAALETGQVDFVDWGPPELFDRVKNHSKITTFLDRMGTFNFIYFNKLVPPFNDVRARQALQLAADQKAFLLTAYPEDQSSPCAAIFGCKQAWESTAGAITKPSLDEAKKLWAQAYKGEKIIMLTQGERPEYYNPSLLTQQILKQLGATVQMFVTDTPTQSALVRNRPATEKGEWNIGHLASINYLDPIVHPVTRTELGYSGYVIDLRLQKLKEDFTVATNDSVRKRITEDYQKIFYERAEGVNLGQSFRYKAHRADVKGVLKSPTSNYQVFWGMWMER